VKERLAATPHRFAHGVLSSRTPQLQNLRFFLARGFGTAPVPQKKTATGAALLACLKRVKRCLNIGKNEQKVSDSTYIKGNRDSFAYNVICF